MENGKFDKKEYNKNYTKTHYVKFQCNVPNDDAKLIEEFRIMKNMTRAELVKEALLYYIDHH